MLERHAGRQGRLLEHGPDLSREAEYDRLPALVRGSVDMDPVYEIAGLDR